MKLPLRTLILESLHDLRRRWPQLLAADLVARILALTLLTPLCGLLLKLFLRTTESGVVTDAAIARFLLHPAGLAALFLCGTFSLAIWFAEMSQLMVIGGGRDGDRNVSVRASLRYVYARGESLIRVAAVVLLRVILLVLPCLAAIGVIYWLWLRDYDINYYLAEKPPAFWIAITAAIALLLPMAFLIVLRLAGWLFALPLALFEGLNGRHALRASEHVAGKHRVKLAAVLVAWVVTPILLAALVHGVIGTIADWVIPRDGSDLFRVVVWLGALILLDLLAQLAIAIGFTILLPLFIVRAYRLLHAGHAATPEIAIQGLPDNGGLAGRRATVFVAGAVVLALSIGGTYLIFQTPARPADCQIIAHRGGADVAPENTHAAFERAIADGAQWLELDVQESADGDVIVVHDRDFMRVGRSALSVHRITDQELRVLDVGSFFSPTFADQRVPRLCDVLEAAKGRVGLFIELKYYGHERALEQSVVDLVEAAGMSRSIVIMSLDYAGVRKASEIRPDWTRGLLNAVSVGDVTQLDVNFLAVAARAASLATIRRAHERGLKLYAWTINDPVQMWVMMSRGVDGVITDRVSLARQVQDLRQKVTPLGRLLIWIAGEIGILRGNQQSSGEDDA